MKDKIGNHNGKILNKKSEPALDNNGNPKQCCTNQLNCPLKPDRYDQKNVIYQADVHADNKVMKYYGSTENEFKKRCSTHKSTFSKVPDSHTTLSSYIWKLKDKGIGYEVKWSIKARGHAFSSGGQACDLCLIEKLINHYPNGRSKYNAKQKKRVARNLQTPKKAPPRIVTSQRETP